MRLLELRVRTPRRWDEWMRSPQITRISNDLHRCWQRALGLGVRPEGPSQEAVLDAQSLRVRRAAHTPLLRSLPEALGPVISGLSSQDFRLLLADTEGTVLHAAGGGAFAPHADAVRLIEGSVWSESIRGTNAIGTALREEQPVAVFGAAHFVRANHALACYAAPIRDPFGTVCGVLDATSFATASAPLAALTVVAAAGTLEAELREQAWAALPSSAGLLRRLLGRFPGAALLIERPGIITRANPAAAGWLGLQLRAGSGEVGLDAVRPSERAMGLDWASLESAALAGRRARVAGHLADLEPVQDGSGRILALAAFLRTPRQEDARPQRADPFRHLAGSDPALSAARTQARRLAATRLPVMLLAETGTGKDLMARAIHESSPRASAPLVAVNCGAMAPDLLMAELFGHAPHAFTGASPKGRAGCLASADGGTLFLDEVAEMSPQMQVALLRFLEDGEYRPVGGGAARRADVRLISATCRDLHGLIQAGRFRADLYYRLCGAPLRLPPVRDRRDIAELALALLRQLAATEGMVSVPRLSPETGAWMAAQPWPGNVRQLKTALHYAMVIADGAPISPAHFPPSLGPAPAAAIPAPREADGRSLSDAEGEALQQALAESGGNISAAARMLGVARSTVYRLMERHGLR